MTSSFLLRLLAGLGAALTLWLAGCGSGSTYEPFNPFAKPVAQGGGRIVVFGDGYSAVTNTGETLAGVRNASAVETNSTVSSRLASYYGAALAPISTGALPAGNAFSYATGDARVNDTVTQINTFLASNSVRSDDLFVITVGALDIYDAANAGNTTMSSTVTDALANAIKQLTDAGAKHVLYMMPINMARTPWGLNPTVVGGNGSTSGNSSLASTAQIQNLSYDSSTGCNSFQCKLTLKLSSYYPATSSGNPVLVADIQSYFNLLSGTTTTGSANTFSSYGIYNPDLPVCTIINSSPNPTSSNNSTTVILPPQGCASSATNTGTDSAYTTTAYDWTTSLFADNLFLTPVGNRLLADYIYGTLMYRAGWR